MITFSISAGILLALGATCYIVSSFIMWQETGEVNRKLPDVEQIAYWGMYPGKMAKIRNEYRRLYPDGKLDLMRRIFQLAGAVFLVLLIFQLRRFM